MARTIEVKFSEVSEIIRAAFPGAASRRPVKINRADTYSVRDYWDGGSRGECRFVEVTSLKVMRSDQAPREALQRNGNPYNLPIYTVSLTPAYMVVEHTIFCGKDMGYRIHVCNERFDSLPVVNVGEKLTSYIPCERLLPA
jgi:hypothetical protein